jgi:uncharacterized protein YacL
MSSCLCGLRPVRYTNGKMSSSKRAILDTSAILDRPEVLARVGHGRIVIPEAVFSELTRAKGGRQGDAIGALIQQATARGAKIVPSPRPESPRVCRWR